MGNRINHDKSEYDESNKERKEKILMDISYDFFALTTLICLGVFAFFREAPFGDKTLAASDAFIQYMDLMAFLRMYYPGISL